MYQSKLKKQQNITPELSYVLVLDNFRNAFFSKKNIAKMINKVITVLMQLLKVNLIVVIYMTF